MENNIINLHKTDVDHEPALSRLDEETFNEIFKDIRFALHAVGTGQMPADEAEVWLLSQIT